MSNNTEFIYKFEITPHILKLSTEISSLIGRFDLSLKIYEPLSLRKQTLARTIHSSALIEGNTLTLGEVTKIISGEIIKGPKKDITEIKNLHLLYKKMDDLDPLNVEHFLLAHKILMKGLLPSEDMGIRTKNVGIISDGEITYSAPTASIVKSLLEQMFCFDFSIYPALISSSIMHHMIETIHPFIDGNGRIGRFWQSLFLYHYHSKTFGVLPIESLIQSSVQDYYNALKRTREKENFSFFVEYILKVILKCVKSHEKLLSKDSRDTLGIRLERAYSAFKEVPFSRKEYLGINSDISTATGSNDLASAVKAKKIKKIGTGNQSRYYFV